MQFTYMNKYHDEDNGALKLATRCRLDIIIHFDGLDYDHMTVNGFEHENKDHLYDLYVKIGDDVLNQSFVSLASIADEAAKQYFVIREQADAEYELEMEHYRYVSSPYYAGRV